jgi:hypothetical protein
MRSGCMMKPKKQEKLLPDFSCFDVTPKTEEVAAAPNWMKQGKSKLEMSTASQLSFRF